MLFGSFVGLQIHNYYAEFSHKQPAKNCPRACWCVSYESKHICAPRLKRLRDLTQYISLGR